jgi:hypothetical protein
MTQRGLTAGPSRLPYSLKLTHSFFLEESADPRGLY